jgi:hypothetical protein
VTVPVDDQACPPGKGGHGIESVHLRVVAPGGAVAEPGMVVEHDPALGRMGGHVPTEPVQLIGVARAARPRSLGMGQVRRFNQVRPQEPA